MQRLLLLAAVALALTGCIAPGQLPGGTASGGLAETVSVGGLPVTPLAVVEDSRCPAGVQCIQAGTVRIRVRLGASEAVLTLGRPHSIDAQLALTLTGVAPERREGDGVTPGEYRFTFALGAAPVAQQDSPIALTVRPARSYAAWLARRIPGPFV